MRHCAQSEAAMKAYKKGLEALKPGRAQDNEVATQVVALCATRGMLVSKDDVMAMLVVRSLSYA